ncbi:MAG: TlpA family protein disulfide reductase [Thiotrichales bacterium]|nr:MAG: TlpA family protein disulfide reductase [Thiotrichales bacterium]
MVKTFRSTSLTLYLLTGLLLPLSASSAELEPYTATGEYGFSLPDLRDQTHALPNYKGKVVLINFWASWCPPCIYEMPELTQLKKQMAGKPFEILAINVGEKKYKVRKFTKLINFELPVLLDTRSQTFDSWGVKTLPTSFLVDANGQVRYWVRGNPGWKYDYTLSVINELITEATTSANLNTSTLNEDKP